MKKKDIILIGTILLIALISYLVIHFRSNNTGNIVIVSVSGEIYGKYPLNENRIIDVNENKGHNRIVINDGKVYMEEADCPDKYCVSQGKISKTGEIIVCLPHKLSVEIKNQSEATDEIDAVAK